MSLPSHIQKYFWDIDPKKAQPKKHPEYYIKRILELGDEKAFGWIKRTFGLVRIKKVVKTARFSSKSKNYWKLILNV